MCINCIVLVSDIKAQTNLRESILQFAGLHADATDDQIRQRLLDFQATLYEGLDRGMFLELVSQSVLELMHPDNTQHPILRSFNTLSGGIMILRWYIEKYLN